jgi:dihydrofolate reductase
MFVSVKTNQQQMRKIISLMHISLDGFCAGPNGEMDWITMNNEIMKDVTGHLERTDTALYGRTTYQMMESYWPTIPSDPSSTQEEKQHAEWVENIQKIVFSKSLSEVHWNNTRLIKKNIMEEMTEMKAQPGKDMMIFGSPRLVHTFMEMGLIDEYLLNINPVAIGEGIPFFKNLEDRLRLKLSAHKIYESGVVSLQYETASN